MTPLEIEIILHYGTRGCDFRAGDFSAPAVRQTIDNFRGDAGLLRIRDSRFYAEPMAYTLTEKGRALFNLIIAADSPVPMRLTCPICGALHIDEGDFATKPHHTHSCQSCGMTWRPAVVCTVGVQFLPGFKNNL